MTPDIGDIGDMGMGMALGGLRTGHTPQAARPRASVDHGLRTRVSELDRKIARLELANRLLWELLRDGLKLSEADMEKRMKEIDMRDGVDDDRITEVPMRCPSCSRVSSSKHWKCLYCGQDFERFAY